MHEPGSGMLRFLFEEIAVADHQQRSLARQLMDILDAYQASFERWSREPSDVGLYERTRANLELVRVLTDKAFPGGRGELGELLLVHGELKLLVLRLHIGRAARRPPPSGAMEQLEALRGRHGATLTALRMVCRQRVGGPPSPCSPGPGGAGRRTSVAGR